MNLIDQFPDVSEKMRANIRMSRKNYASANAIQPLSYSEGEAVSRYYEGEFRRWHFKLLFIVAASVGIVYLALLNGAWIFNLIAAR
jgi:hypothetical protein